MGVFAPKVNLANIQTFFSHSRVAFVRILRPFVPCADPECWWFSAHYSAFALTKPIDNQLSEEHVGYSAEVSIPIPFRQEFYLPVEHRTVFHGF